MMVPKKIPEIAEKIEDVKEEIIDHEEAKPEEIKKELQKKAFDKEKWHPKSDLGKKVKSGEVTDLGFILDNSMKIFEAEIVDCLEPNLDVDLLMIGQSKGKFGGGQRRIFKQTQKKTKEGNKPHFATIAAIGNHNGLVGLGYGKSKETVPAREKAIRNAKINIMKIRRGCGSWECGCHGSHTIPFAVTGKSGSIRLTLIPAPKGTGLCVEREVQKILGLAGIKDVWSKTFGKTTINLIYACLDALQQLNKTKLTQHEFENMGIVDGKIKEV
jgi:small subunit ribosomal protein S5